MIGWWIRKTIGRTLGRVLASSLANVRPRIIYDGEGINPYLSRYYLFGAPSMPDGSSPFDSFGNLKRGANSNAEQSLGLYIHKFHRSDVDRELHNHPWRWALSFVIAGGYREERRMGNRVVSRVVPPLSLNFIRDDDYHRVDLMEEDAWTLFLVGPKTQAWAFWERKSGETTPWREFLSRKQGAG